MGKARNRWVGGGNACLRSKQADSPRPSATPLINEGGKNRHISAQQPQQIGIGQAGLGVGTVQQRIQIPGAVFDLL